MSALQELSFQRMEDIFGRGAGGGAKGLFFVSKIFGRGAGGVPRGHTPNVHFRVL